ncbi:MAG: class I SAM-dependent methyltransferase [Symploca sp. SIO2C1]|nr:class I SAM-dependent methyltransferase [Symploca sp. SIO2C1]
MTFNKADLQKEHYEKIYEDYDKSYYDAPSMAFRQKFVYDIMFQDLDLNNKNVADLASGSGFNSLAVMERYPKARLTGFDISSKACRGYRQNTGCDAYEIDLTKSIDISQTFDIAMIFGGIHHCVYDLDSTFRNIASILKPGGVLLMWEPNKECFLDKIRSFWYQADKYFEADTEDSLVHQELLNLASNYYSSMDVHYMGGPAYFLILNSLVFRIPIAIKPIIAPPLFLAEQVYNKLPHKIWFPYFIARWSKK